jgi:hypothetical protein
MVTIAPPSAFWGVIGRNHHQLLSHFIASMSQEGPPVSLFPRGLPAEDFTVVFLGATQSDKDKAKKVYRVRRDRVKAVFDYLHQNSVPYADCSMCEEGLEALPLDGIGGNVENDDNDPSLIATVLREGERVGSIRSSPGVEVSTDVFVGLVSMSNTSICRRVAEQSDQEVDGMRKFQVRGGGGILREQMPHHYSSAFPRHFPNGVGTPNCDRPVRVSKESAFRRYLLQGDRVIAQDFTFVLKAFDEMSRKQLFRRMFLKLRANPGVALKAAAMTGAQLDAGVSLSCVGTSRAFREANSSKASRVDSWCSAGAWDGPECSRPGLWEQRGAHEHGAACERTLWTLRSTAFDDYGDSF